MSSQNTITSQMFLIFCQCVYENIEHTKYLEKITIQYLFKLLLLDIIKKLKICSIVVLIIFLLIVAVTTISSLALVASDFGFLSAYLSSRFGHIWSLTLGLILTATSYLLLWSSLFFKQFFQANTWLLYLFYIIAGMLKIRGSFCIQQSQSVSLTTISECLESISVKDMACCTPFLNYHPLEQMVCLPSATHNLKWVEITHISLLIYENIENHFFLPLFKPQSIQM